MRSTRFLCEECYSDLAQEELHNGDSPYPQMEPSGEVLPLPTPVEITGRVEGDGSDDEINSSPVSSLERRHAHTHTMSTRRVCWHRNTSISMTEHSLSVRNQMSGELLRKFKTGNRWQKLWVVFTNFCLFFYKTHEDEFPLASLPLIGYLVARPVEADGIDKDLVFKLQYKTHVYFFRAENEYTFYRWMEVIASATQSSSRVRLFSRQISSVPWASLDLEQAVSLPPCSPEVFYNRFITCVRCFLNGCTDACLGEKWGITPEQSLKLF